MLQLRQTYKNILGPERLSMNQTVSEIEKVYEKEFKTQRNFTKEKEMHSGPTKDGIVLYVDYIPGKGRGIRASRDIKVDERIWSEVHVASFYDRQLFNQFLTVLPTSLVCDVVLWTYHDNNDRRDVDHFVFEADLGISALCNNGGSSLANVKKKPNANSYDFVADRDITAGEEILCNYEE